MKIEPLDDECEFYQSPDFKGIETCRQPPVTVLAKFYQSPDFKGIETRRLNRYS